MTALASPTQQLLDGAWVDAIDGGRWDVIDPASETVVANVPYGGRDDAMRAIDAAHRAFPGWRARTAYDRGAILRRAADLMRARAAELGRITVRESGKPLAEATREWQIAGDLFDQFAEEGKRVHGYTIPPRVASRRMTVLHEPIGVVGVITAWNFPAYNPARAIAAALGAGCTVVVRPAELTPLSAMAMVAALVEAGTPPGVINLINGEPAAMGQAMLDHPALRKISFTGSTAVGRLLMDGASRTMTRLSLELGGNAPVLILPDVDIEQVAKSAVAAKFRNAGQVCVSPQRFFVDRARLARFEEVAIAETAALRVGSGLDPEVRVGPMISGRHRDRVEAVLGAATAAGASVRAGGRRPPALDRGFFLEPTVLGDVTPDMAVFSDELFGPILVTTGFDQLEEAVARANQTSYGLAAYVFTRDLAAAVYAYEHLDFGMIGVNEWAPQATEAPFPGRKASGLGHEGGREGLMDNLETKLVTIGGLDAVIAEHRIFDDNAAVWLDGAAADEPAPALARDLTVDVAIIGGGFTGVSTAFHLAGRFPSLGICLLEARRLANGASGRNGGLMLNGVTPGDRDLDATAREHALTREAMDSIEALIRDHGLAVRYRRDGCLKVLTSQRSAEEAHAHVEALAARGAPLRYLPAAELAPMLQARGAAGAVLDPTEGVLNGVDLIRAMRPLVAGRGVQVFESTRVIRVREGKVIELETPGGTVRASAIVLATNGYTPQLGYFRTGILPVISHVIATDPLPPDVIARGFGTAAGFSDDLPRLAYASIEPGGRLVFGGGSNRSYGYQFRNATAFVSRPDDAGARALRRTLATYFPALGDVAIRHRWTGPLGVTLQRHCAIGVRGAHANVYYALGYSGHGVVLANLAGRVITDLYAGDHDPRRGHAFYMNRPSGIPPEPMRWLGYHAYTKLTGRSPWKRLT